MITKKGLIKSILAKIQYDPREKPEEYLIAIRKSNKEGMLVPLIYTRINLSEGFLEFQGSLYPLHRVIGIYKKNRGWIFFRRFNVKISPFEITMPDFNFELRYMFDDYDIQRFFPLICHDARRRPSILGTLDLIYNGGSGLKIYRVINGGVLNNTIVLSNFNQGENFVIRIAPTNPPNIKDFTHKFTDLHRISLYDKNTFYVSTLEIRLKKKLILLEVTRQGLEVTSIVQNNSTTDLVFLYNKERRLMLMYDIKDCTFILPKACDQRHNILCPEYNRIPIKELDWYVDKNKKFIGLIHDYDVVFVEV